MSRCSVKLNPAAKDIMASLTLSLNNTSGIKTWTTATFAKGHILVCMLRGHQRLCEASFKNKLHLSCIHIEHSQCLLEKCFVREKENLWPSYSGNESGHFIRHQHSTNWKVQSQISEEATNGIYRVVAPCIDANAQKIKPCGPNRVLHKQNRKTNLYCIYCKVSVIFKTDMEQQVIHMAIHHIGSSSNALSLNDRKCNTAVLNVWQWFKMKLLPFVSLWLFDIIEIWAYCPNFNGEVTGVTLTLAEATKRRGYFGFTR